MMPYFEKTLCSVAQEIGILYFFSFYYKIISRRCLQSLFDTVVIVIVLLLLNVIVT